MSVGEVLLALGVVAAIGALALVYGRRYFRNTAAFPPPGSWPEEADPAKSTSPARLEDLELLHDRGEIDDTEYAARRRELMR